jgi:hypothetical protein
VSADGDEARLLHVRSELAYTADPHHALRDEPEAVSADEQRRQTQASHVRDRRRRVDAFVAMRDVVYGALDGFLDAVGPGHGVEPTVRAAKRSVAQLETRIGR